MPRFRPVEAWNYPRVGRAVQKESAPRDKYIPWAAISIWKPKKDCGTGPRSLWRQRRQDAAHRCSELRYVLLRHLPDGLKVDAHVVVNQHVPQSRDAAPRRSRVRLAQRVGQPLDRFA